MSCELPSIAMPRMQRARRLHLARHDRDLGADQGIEQRRFAGIRRADQRDETAAGLRPRQPSGYIRRDAFARQHRRRRGLLGGAL